MHADGFNSSTHQPPPAPRQPHPPLQVQAPQLEAAPGATTGSSQSAAAGKIEPKHVAALLQRFPPPLQAGLRECPKLPSRLEAIFGLPRTGAMAKQLAPTRQAAGPMLGVADALAEDTKADMSRRLKEVLVKKQQSAVSEQEDKACQAAADLDKELFQPMRQFMRPGQHLQNAFLRIALAVLQLLAPTENVAFVLEQAAVAEALDQGRAPVQRAIVASDLLSAGGGSGSAGGQLVAGGAPSAQPALLPAPSLVTAMETDVAAVAAVGSKRPRQEADAPSLGPAPKRVPTAAPGPGAWQDVLPQHAMALVASARTQASAQARRLARAVAASVEQAVQLGVQSALHDFIDRAVNPFVTAAAEHGGGRGQALSIEAIMAQTAAAAVLTAVGALEHMQPLQPADALPQPLRPHLAPGAALPLAAPAATNGNAEADVQAVPAAATPTPPPDMQRSHLVAEPAQQPPALQPPALPSLAGLPLMTPALSHEQALASGQATLDALAAGSMMLTRTSAARTDHASGGGEGQQRLSAAWPAQATGSHAQPGPSTAADLVEQPAPRTGSKPLPQPSLGLFGVSWLGQGGGSFPPPGGYGRLCLAVRPYLADNKARRVRAADPSQAVQCCVHGCGVNLVDRKERMATLCMKHFPLLSLVYDERTGMLSGLMRYDTHKRQDNPEHMFWFHGQPQDSTKKFHEGFQRGKNDAERQGGASGDCKNEYERFWADVLAVYLPEVLKRAPSQVVNVEQVMSSLRHEQSKELEDLIGERRVQYLQACLKAQAHQEQRTPRQQDAGKPWPGLDAAVPVPTLMGAAHAAGGYQQAGQGFAPLLSQGTDLRSSQVPTNTVAWGI